MQAQIPYIWILQNVVIIIEVGDAVFEGIAVNKCGKYDYG